MGSKVPPYKGGLVNDVFGMRSLSVAAFLLSFAPAAAAAEPVHSCVGLKGFSTGGFVIAESQEVGAGRVEGVPDRYEPAQALPEHCLVRGSAGERVGEGGRRFELRFELRMPSDWNGRFLFEGGGELDGVDWPAFGTLFGRLTPSALARGFAVVRTNSGHVSPEGRTTDVTFALDQQARIDYGFQALDRVTRAAKEVIGVYYGHSPNRSYFAGCSNGGRQAMLVAQRLPSYFDGVVAGNPAFNITRLAPRLVWNIQRLSRIAPKDSAGRPILSKAYSDADLQLVEHAVLKQCDALDGLADGMINDVAACHFDPGVLACHGAKTASCLSPDQVAAMRDVMRGPVDASGTPIYKPYPYGADFAKGWRATHLGSSPTAEANSMEVMGGLPTLRYYSLTPPQPNLDPLTFDLAKTLPQIRQTAALNDADWTFLNSFAAHGKLILYHGTSDYSLSANQLSDWYDSLRTDTGGHTQDWARLFLVPGMGHCGGGTATDNFDPLDSIVKWVEGDEPPDRIIATGKTLPGISRPLCPWPKVARYTGGDASKAESFECR